jgi:hypothetical protein
MLGLAAGDEGLPGLESLSWGLRVLILVCLDTEELCDAGLVRWRFLDCLPRDAF